jgi:hypothetical protein
VRGNAEPNHLALIGGDGSGDGPALGFLRERRKRETKND